VSQQIQSIRGMHDIMPAEIPYWHFLESTLRDTMAAYCYEEIRTPLVEKTELFVRAIGDTTDVVEKEMYSFEDRGGDHLSLRPEGTASVVRAALQHGILYGGPTRLWYCGPMFRRERPQRGRTRQFHQVGVEAFGAEGPDIDAEVIALGNSLWRKLGLGGLVLQINSLGTAEERVAFRNALYAFLETRKDDLDEDSLRRLDRNPLRILDSKNPKVQETLQDAPVLSDYLGPGSRAQFDGLQELLEGLGVEFELNPRLVRGLDYYSHAVFEWVSHELGAQGTVCAGGRYDGLIEIQGGKPWPAVGFAMGLERTIELIRQNSSIAPATPHAYLVMVGDGTDSHGLMLAERLRRELPTLRLLTNIGGGSFKAQFRRADKSGAMAALILGENELANGEVTIKPLRDDGDQQTIPESELLARLRELTEN
jgi:histidyl-tRNA synthetase